MINFLRKYFNIKKEEKFRKNKFPVIEVWNEGMFDSEGNKSTPSARPQDIWVGSDPATSHTTIYIRRWINETNTANKFRCFKWLKRNKKKS